MLNVGSKYKMCHFSCKTGNGTLSTSIMTYHKINASRGINVKSRSHGIKIFVACGAHLLTGNKVPSFILGDRSSFVLVNVVKSSLQLIMAQHASSSRNGNISSNSRDELLRVAFFSVLPENASTRQRRQILQRQVTE